jgi:hypothetical protein
MFHAPTENKVDDLKHSVFYKELECVPNKFPEHNSNENVVKEI